MLHEGGPLTAQAQLRGQRRGKHNKLFHTTVLQLFKSIKATHLTTDSWQCFQGDMVDIPHNITLLHSRVCTAEKAEDNSSQQQLVLTGR